MRTTSDCTRLESQLAVAADRHEPAPDAAQLDRALTAHLEDCEACRTALSVQRAVRLQLVRHRKALQPTVPPGVRTRMAARMAGEAHAEATAPGWGFRASPLAAAAALVLVATVGLLPVVTGQSSVVLAAQLALDHVKCFLIDGDLHGQPMTAAEAETAMRQQHGWSVPVSATGGVDNSRLVALRECLYGEGLAAHLLYRVGDMPVSLFVMRDADHVVAPVSVLATDSVSWNRGGHTHMLVGPAGSRPTLDTMARHLQDQGR